MPVKDYTIPVALSVLGPEYRLNKKKILDLVEGVKESAKKISNNLKILGRSGKGL